MTRGFNDANFLELLGIGGKIVNEEVFIRENKDC